MKRTQKFYLLTILLILPIFLIFSCRKEEPVQLPSNGQLGSILSCDNGIMDGEEDGVDCGGVCEPCANSQTGPCNINYNEKSQVESSNAMANVSFNKSKTFISNGKYTILATNNTGDSIKFTFPDSEVMFFQSYNPTNKASLDSNNVFIEARLISMPNGGWGQSGSPHYYESDLSSEGTIAEHRVHLNLINGKENVSFCKLRLREKSQGGVYSFEGQITEN